MKCEHKIWMWTCKIKEKCSWRSSNGVLAVYLKSPITGLWYSNLDMWKFDFLRNRTCYLGVPVHISVLLFYLSTTANTLLLPFFFSKNHVTVQQGLQPSHRCYLTLLNIKTKSAMVRDYILRSSVSPVFPLHIMQPQVTATFITNQCGSEAKYKKINFTVMYIQHVYNTSPRSGCYNNHCTSSPVISKLNVLEATHTFTDTNKRKTKVGWGSLLQGKKKKKKKTPIHQRNMPPMLEWALLHIQVRSCA